MISNPIDIPIGIHFFIFKLPGKRPARLIGISVSQLYDQGGERQLSLFQKESIAPRKRKLNLALDEISEKYGKNGIVPGTLLKK